MIRKPIIAGLLVLAVLAAAAGAETEKADPPTRILLKKTEPRSVASMRHTGPMEEIPAVATRLVTLLNQGGYDMTGPLMAVYHNNPEEVAEEELVWEIWAPVAYPGPIRIAENDEMGFRHIDPMFVAFTYHIGPYLDLAEAYDSLIDWAMRNEYKIVGPPVELYWSDPMTVPEEKLVTEVWFPVEEKRVPGIVK